MNQSLPKKLRIRERREIQQMLFQGRKYIGTYLILYCLPSQTSGSPTRAGFLSPKKIGNAVRRNKVRRQIREAFRKHREELDSSHQILMMGRASATRADYQALHDDFLKLCRKARLLTCDS